MTETPQSFAQHFAVSAQPATWTTPLLWERSLRRDFFAMRLMPTAAHWFTTAPKRTNSPSMRPAATPPLPEQTV